MKCCDEKCDVAQNGNLRQEPVPPSTCSHLFPASCSTLFLQVERYVRRLGADYVFETRQILYLIIR